MKLKCCVLLFSLAFMGCGSAASGDSAGAGQSTATDGTAATVGTGNGQDSTDGASSKDGTTGTDNTTQSDSDTSIGLDGTDGVGGTDGDGNGSFGDGGSGNGGLDPLTRINTVALKGPSLSNGALTVADDAIYVCDNDKLVTMGMDFVVGTETQLSSKCSSVTTHSSAVFASTVSGQWHRLPDTKTDGPRAHALAANETHVYGALGTDGIAVAKADLSAPATTYAVAADARDLILMNGGLLVADGIKGIKWFNLNDGIPTLAGSLDDFGGSALGIAAVDDTKALLAMAGRGVVMVDVKNGKPEVVGHLDITLDSNAASWSVDIAVGANGTALLADWLDARLIDINDPTNMNILGRERFVPTDGKHWRALGAGTTKDGYVVLGLDHVTHLKADPTAVSAEITLEVGSLTATAVSADTQIAILIPNTGKGNLHINSVTSSDPRVSVADGSFATDGIQNETDFMVIGGKDIGYIPLDVVAGNATSLTLTMVTNDPDYPELVIPVDINPPVLAVNQDAPDFTLPGIYGEMIQLSELKGTVLLLKLFNSQ